MIFWTFPTHMFSIFCQFSHTHVTFLVSKGLDETSLHWENYISISIRIEWDMIVVILNQMEFHLVHNRKENCRHDHISFNVKGNGNIVFSVWGNISISSLEVIMG